MFAEVEHEEVSLHNSLGDNLLTDVTCFATLPLGLKLSIRHTVSAH